jgi:hypothetical protein
MPKEDKIILSLFDYSGNWSRPYREAGYNVIQHDIKLGWDIFEDTLPAALEDHHNGIRVHGILAAQPCTDFTISGARFWKEKDQKDPPVWSKDVHFENRLDYWITMVYTVLAVIEFLNPKWWCLENPVGRIADVVPELKRYRMLTFQPWEFGDPYSKRTVLYGQFNPWLVRNPVKPIETRKGHHSIDEYYQVKGQKNRADTRSITPLGFARSFFMANP